MENSQQPKLKLVKPLPTAQELINRYPLDLGQSKEYHYAAAKRWHQLADRQPDQRYREAAWNHEMFAALTSKEEFDRVVAVHWIPQLVQRILVQFPPIHTNPKSIAYGMSTIVRILECIPQECPQEIEQFVLSAYLQYVYQFATASPEKLQTTLQDSGFSAQQLVKLEEVVLSSVIQNADTKAKLFDMVTLLQQASRERFVYHMQILGEQIARVRQIIASIERTQQIEHYSYATEQIQMCIAGLEQLHQVAHDMGSDRLQANIRDMAKELKEVSLYYRCSQVKSRLDQAA